MSRINWLQLDMQKNWKNFPIVACCYVIYFDGDLVYIGSTNNLRNRFSGHSFRYGYCKNIHTPWCEISDSTKIIIKYRPSTIYGDWLMREARLIKKIQPKFNSKLKGRKNALL